MRLLEAVIAQSVARGFSGGDYSPVITDEMLRGDESAARTVDEETPIEDNRLRLIAKARMYKAIQSGFKNSTSV